MSLGSKIAIYSAIGASIGTIGYVHFKQKIDKDRMHEGVVKDIERQRRRRAENVYILQQQIDLGRELKKKQLSEGENIT